MARSEDDADEQAQRQREDYAHRIRELRRIPDKVGQAYRDAWQLFYAWEPPHCEHMLHSLRTLRPHRVSSDYEEYLEEPLVDDMQIDSDAPSTFSIWPEDLEDTDSEPVTARAEHHRLPRVSVHNFAYPKYEACTPATRNICHTNDPGILEFIPYADEPRFRRLLFSKLYERLAWQACWYDVDFKLVALRAILTVHDSGISLVEMDKHEFAFIPRLLGRNGLISEMRHRDVIDWDQSFPSISKQLVALDTAPRRGLWKDVNILNSLFCSSTNCIEAHCMVHASLKPPMRPQQHRKENGDFTQDARRCSDECYRDAEKLKVLLPEGQEFMQLHPKKDICDVLKLFPDDPICQLAKLCRADCNDVYYHRLFLLQDGTGLKSLIPHDEDDESSLLGYTVDDNLCNHPGPCVDKKVCPCARRKRTCSGRCACAGKCAQHKGCTCEDNECDEETCACRLAGRECSPRHCRSYRPRTKKSKKREKKKEKARAFCKHSCSNTRLQKDRKPNLVVEKGSYGLGTFAPDNIRKGAYLGEYIAEMLPNLPDDEGGRYLDKAQRKLNRHRGLNYLFTLNDRPYVLDAATVGDPTRCLNDSEDKAKVPINAGAEPIEVDGDMRIYFYTNRSVKAGKELLLDYGENYWKGYDEPSSDEDGLVEDGPCPSE